ncbi:MAG: ATP synthase subunit F [Clostridiales bacterium]|nr:ATP synthase subunit F [Clostridiales bacterium]
MKIFLLTDNTDTAIGMRLAGVKSVVVHNRETLSAALDKALQNPEYGMILYTSKLREIAEDIIISKTEGNPRIIFYEIPDRHGYKDKTSSISDVVKSSVGIQI